MTAAYTLDKTYWQIMNLLDETNEILIGFGRTTQWQIEAIPNAVDRTKYEVEELIGFIRVGLRAPVIYVPTVETAVANIRIEGKNFNYIDPTIQSLRKGFCKHILLSGVLNHVDLPVEIFRSIGIYVDCVIDQSVSANDRFIPANKLKSGYLYYLENMQPISKQSGVQQTFRRVLEI